MLPKLAPKSLMHVISSLSEHAPNLLAKDKQAFYVVLDQIALPLAECERGRSGRLDEFIAKYERMGWKPKDEVLETRMRALSEEDRAEEAFKYFHQLIKCTRVDGKQHLGAYKSLLKCFLRAKSYVLAVDVLFILEQHVRLGTSYSLYCEVLHELGRVGEVELLLRLLVLMRQSRTPPRESTFGAVIHRLLSGKRWAEAKQVFEYLQASKVKVNALHLNRMLHYCHVHRESEQFAWCLGLFQQHRVPLTAETYGMRIVEAGHLGQLDMLPAIQQEMRDNQVAMDARVYQSILSVYTLYPLYLERAKSILLHEIPQQLVDAQHFAVVMRGFLRFKQFEEAVQVFQELEVRGLKSTQYTYTLLLDGIQRYGEWKGVVALWRILQEKEGWPEIVDEHGQPRLLQDYLANLCDSSQTTLTAKTITPATVSVFLDACAYHQQFDMAACVISYLEHFNYAHFDANIASSYVEALIKQGKIHDALDDLYRLLTKFRQPLLRKTARYLATCCQNDPELTEKWEAIQRSLS
jgi:pentatricopeptide repeat protein